MSLKSISYFNYSVIYNYPKNSKLYPLRLKINIIDLQEFAKLIGPSAVYCHLLYVRCFYAIFM